MFYLCRPLSHCITLNGTGRTPHGVSSHGLFLYVGSSSLGFLRLRKKMLPIYRARTTFSFGA